MTTSSGDDTKEHFNYDVEEDIESEFNKEEDGDKEEGNYFIN